MAASQINCFQLMTAYLCLLNMPGIAAQRTGGQKLRMLTNENPPFVIVNKQSGDLEGFIPDLMSQIGKIISGEFQLSIQENKTEMIDRILHGISDVAGPLIITAKRERQVDFTKPILSSGIVPVIKKPVKIGPQVNLFWYFTPFSSSVWLLIVFAFVAVSIVLYLIYRFNPRERKATSSDEEEDFDILGSFLFALSCLTWQGYKQAPRSIGGRILAAFWWMFVLLVITSYIAKLVHFMSLTDQAGYFPLMPESMEDLVKDDSYRLGAVPSSAEFEFFKQSRIAVYERAFAIMNNPLSRVISVEEGIERVRQDGKFVFLADSMSVRYSLDRAPCDLMTAGPSLSSWGIGLAVRPGSNFKDPITLAILELQETGAIQTLISKWWTKQCAPYSLPSRNDMRPTVLQGSTGPLKLVELGGASILLFVGVLISVLVSLAELFWIRHKNNKTPEEAEKAEGSAMIDTATETAKV